MTTLERIDSDLKAGMKAKNERVVSVLRMLRAALKNVAIDKGKDLDEEDVIAVLGSEAKKLRDALQQFKDGGRADLVEQNEQELAVISAYLPAQLSDDELKAIVAAKKAETGAGSPQDFGKLMGVVMAATKGQAEGNRVSAMVKAALSPDA
jgi:uncharacterized protein YqeY